MDDGTSWISSFYFFGAQKKWLLFSCYLLKIKGAYAINP
jgi:hypothetical protein